MGGKEVDRKISFSRIKSYLKFAICLPLILAVSMPIYAGERHPRIGLVLSGGGARGAAHIGVLQVLETLRVPISCVVGTSMGSIVGGAYAAGAPTGSLQKIVGLVNLDALFNEAPARQDRSIIEKFVDGSSYVTPDLGWRDGEILLPVAALSGVALEGVLRELSPIRRPLHFDNLPIPFRAIATDVVSGKMAVLDHGELHLAMRASMSIPGVLVPIEIDNQLLVDGGLTRNLGIDIARKLCADIVIAVNVGTPIAGRESISSIVGMSEQMINLLTEQNVNRSKAELNSKDILIEPELNGLTSGDFDKLAEIVPRGATAARLQENALRQLSLTNDEYAAFRETQATPPTTATAAVVKGIRIYGLKRVHPDAVRAAMRTRVGDRIDTAQLTSDMQQILDLGDFSRADYRLTDQANGQFIDVYPVERPWGPNYVRAGLKLSTDFQGGVNFSLLAQYRRTWLNEAGAEWRTNLEIGRDSGILTQWYQPLSAGSDYFVIPSLEYRRELIDVFDDRQRIGRVAVDQYRATAYAGRKLGASGVSAIGVTRSFIDPSLQIGSPDLLDTGNSQVAGVEARIGFDTLDNLDFPSRGIAASARIFAASPGLGADDRYTLWHLSIEHATRFDNNALSLQVMGGGALRGALPIYESMSLGGFKRVPGLRQGQLVGDEMLFARMTLTRRLTSAESLQGMRVGVSLETGRIRKPVLAGSPTNFVSGVSIFVGTETVLGPVFLAFGIAERNNRAAYFYLGRP